MTDIAAAHAERTRDSPRAWALGTGPSGATPRDYFVWQRPLLARSRLLKASAMRSRTGRGDNSAENVGREMQFSVPSSAGPGVWHVVGLQRSVPDWAIRQGWGDRPMRQEQAKGIPDRGARDAGDSLHFPGRAPVRVAWSDGLRSSCSTRRPRSRNRLIFVSSNCRGRVSTRHRVPMRMSSNTKG